MAPARLLLPSDLGVSFRDEPMSSLLSPERDKSSPPPRRRLRQQQSPPADDVPDTTQLPTDMLDATLSSQPKLIRFADTVVMPASAAQSPDWLGRPDRPPSDGSLCAVLRKHSGLSLFVRPVGWTDLHTKLLDVRFSELPACESPRPVNVAGSRPPRGLLRPSPTMTSLSAALTEILRPAARHVVVNTNAVQTMLSTLWPAPFTKPLLNPELPLFFGDRAYHKAIRTPIMWNFPSTSRMAAAHDDFDLPMMCYIGKNHLSMMRCSSARPAACPNEPIMRLQRVRSRTLMPANPNHDAHFVAIFIAMAQRHFYPSLAPSPKKESRWWPFESTSPRPKFRDLKLRLLSHDDVTGEFIVYTARVTAKFLERFHKPRKTARDAAGKVPGLDIEYTRIPIWPILGLRERLGKALGQDLVGPFDESSMETWDYGEEEADGKGQAKGKRKRQSVLDIFSEGSEEATDDEGPDRLGVKRRRLAEGSTVGVAA
ncbi:hypothetical protein XA68_15742 [Ophiocordyceps unilateralis]|uniref:Uncharacterized protein n=1 Tax=Ophiocordyceps unilateralis TaxID=268505 RepID=A0A2A9P7T1_OPHUN|nr:hypothetical protein XA68_15742 [Ophiocordyceps unilateralis]